MTDKIKNLLNNNNSFFSIELCSTKDVSLNELSSIKPMFYSVTWHYQNSTKDVLNNPAFELASILATQGQNVLLHLPCRYLNKQNVSDILLSAKQKNIKNILALQGDSIESTEDSNDFKHAIDLVRFIKESFGNYFCVGVAGYPLCHFESSSLAMELMHLKQKVEAGADFIITQVIFETETFNEFYKNCREFGITIPIIPGLYLINSYNALLTMSKICHVQVPQTIWNCLKSIKDNNTEIENYGLYHATELINNLLANKECPVLDVHLFSLNNIESVRLLIENVRLSQ